MRKPEEETARRLRVGAFFIGSVTVFLLLVFVLGRQENLFVPKVRITTAFEDLGGLVVGAPVRLAGIDIGIVEDIRFDDDPEIGRVQVVLAIDQRQLGRIRADSTANLASRGLLGDMLINISLGTPKAPPLAPGAFLPSKESASMGQAISSVESAVGEVKKLTQDVQERVALTFTAELARDLHRFASASAEISEGVATKNGLIHRLIYDPETADQVMAVVSEARGVAERTRLGIGRLERILAEIETGDGFVHGLIYDPRGTEAVADLQRLAGELADVAGELKDGNGMLHSLIYSEDKSNLIADLSAAARLVRQMTEEVQEGKGTVGGLLKDPTVYQDLKTVLGNVKRNALLRWMIRLTIKKDDLERIGEVDEAQATQ